MSTGIISEEPITNSQELRYQKSDNLDRLFFHLSSLCMEPFCLLAELFTRCISSLNGYDKNPPNTWNYLPKKSQEIAFRTLVGLATIFVLFMGLKYAPTTTLALPCGLFLLGKVFRVIAFSLQKEDYTHVLGKGKEIPFQIQNGVVKTSIAFANSLGPHGGYNYTNGGSVPARERALPIANKLFKKNPDTYGFLEMYDTAFMEKMVTSLDSLEAAKHHFIQTGSNIVLGTTGGEMLSTNKPVHSFQRRSFSNNPTLINTKYVKLEALNRGFSLLALKTDQATKEPFLYLVITHLIHGVNPATKEDKTDRAAMQQSQKARKLQLDEIRKAIPEDANAIVFGDFNIERDSEEGQMLNEYGQLVYKDKDTSSDKPTFNDATCTEYFINEWKGNISWTDWIKSFFSKKVQSPFMDEENEIIDNFLILHKKKEGKWTANNNVTCDFVELIRLWDVNKPINRQNPLSDHHGLYAEFSIRLNQEEEGKKTLKASS